MLHLPLILLVGLAPQLGPAFTARQPAPADEVFKFIPSDSSVCFIIRNLRDHARNLTASPFAAWAAEQIGAALGTNQDVQRLQEIRKFLEQFLSITLAELRDDILGDLAVFAYGRGQQPGDERTMIIIHARDPAKLTKLLERLNELQRQAGELKQSVESQHRGQTYVARQRDSGNEYYFLRGSLFVLSDNETTLKSVIDQAADGGESPIAASLAELKVQNALLTCWLNPRQLDADLVADADATPSERAGLAQMARLWQGVDQCAIYFTLDAGMELGLSMRYRSEALPEDWRGAFRGVPRPARLWSVIPSDALFAIALNLEVETALKALAAFLPEAERESLHQKIDREIAAILGREASRDILKAIGPEFGLWVEAPDSPEALPRALFAAHLNEQSRADIATKMTQLLDFYARLIVYDYNRHHQDHITLEAQKSGTLDLLVFRNDVLFPSGFSPSCAAVQGFLLITSAPTAIKAFQAPAPDATQTSTDVPLVRLRARALGDVANAHRSAMLQLLASLHGAEEKAIAEKLDAVLPLIGACESMELVVRGKEGARIFALKLQMIKPLK